MKTPKRILPLVEDGMVDEVIHQLMSGKEASVYTVRRGSDIICAKVYKEANQRSFKKAAQYQEGRKVRNSRRARAMEKGSKFGRDQQEESWQSAEVDALYRLANIGVRVPQPYGCFHGVLLMELITDDANSVAPRLNDVTMSANEAQRQHDQLMHDVMKMLCAGIVHGDLSEFNVLVDDKGPVIIDLPQAIDAAANNNAKVMLKRDVANITHYYAKYEPKLLETKYAEEIWALYEQGKLQPDLKLTGQFEETNTAIDLDAVLEEIQVAFDEAQEKKRRVAEESSGLYL